MKIAHICSCTVHKLQLHDKVNSEVTAIDASFTLWHILVGKSILKL
jgi:hypothetical protein